MSKALLSDTIVIDNDTGEVVHDPGDANYQPNRLKNLLKKHEAIPVRYDPKTNIFYVHFKWKGN